MEQENVASVTLLLSLVIHTAILTAIPLFKNIPQKKELTNIEVTYKSATGIKSSVDRGGISKELLSIKQRSLPKTDLPQDKVRIEEPRKPQIEQPYKLDLSQFVKPQETIAVSKPQLQPTTPKKQKISFSIPVEMSKDPVYLGYRDVIRKKIQDKVYYYSNQYFYFDYPREGKIFIYFTVASNGVLKELHIVDDKSSTDKTLRKIVTNAIEKSSPFPLFPKDLRYDDRSFNLEVSFELE
ncbi:MAG: hypothetical protein PHS93_03975 [Candidatus Omnitrophica bacterium]|nr:hypothetical protein [Candidatus Omnitrophota bacterium]MDD5352310.1 hypothetical protein [Candidatus Omnitrophota bacterium]MDD5549908.1 hypothetical protein [Candidatus Omnitrophota bacterium]